MLLCNQGPPNPFGSLATVATTDGNATTIATIGIPADTTVFIQATVTARRTGGASHDQLELRYFVHPEPFLTMGELNLNGWWDSSRFDLELTAGDNDNITAYEHMVLIPVAPANVTGFIPPDTEHTWLMTVSNGGADDITFTHNDAGSTEGFRTMMPPGFTSYTLALGQTATFVYTIALDPETTGWYPLVPGTLNA